MPKMYRVVGGNSLTWEYFDDDTGDVLARSTKSWPDNDESSVIADIKEARKAKKVKLKNGQTKEIDKA
jgi:hypothetical protein